MSTLVCETGNYARIATATTTVVRSGPTRVLGVIVASTTAGTVQIFDNTSVAAPIALNTAQFPVGFTPLPMTLNTGLTVVTGGTIDCTIVFDPA